jgi:hypothetical protein
VSYTYDAPTNLVGVITPPLTVALDWDVANEIGGGGSGGGGGTDPYYADVGALLFMDGTNGSGTFIDSGPNAFTVSKIGSPVQSNAEAPSFTTTSGDFSTTEAVTVPVTSSGPLDFGTGDFTVEGWFYITFTTGEGTFLANNPAGLNAITVNATRKALVGGGMFNVNATLGSALSNVWNAFAYVRISGTLTLYMNGVLAGTAANTIITSTGTWTIGGKVNPSIPLPIFLSNIRFTKGVGRYTSNYTPSGPFDTVNNPPAGYNVYREGVSLGPYTGAPGLTDTVPAYGTYLYTVAASDGATDLSAASSPPLSVTFVSSIPTIDLSTKFVGPAIFKALMVANPGYINPRVYPPEIDTTVRVVPRTIT